MPENLTLTLPESEAVVTYKSELSWWDMQEIEAPAVTGTRVMIRGGQNDSAQFAPTILMDIKKKLMERAIISVQAKGAEKAEPYTFGWLQTLSRADGEALNEVLEAVKKK